MGLILNMLVTLGSVVMLIYYLYKAKRKSKHSNLCSVCKVNLFDYIVNVGNNLGSVSKSTMEKAYKEYDRGTCDQCYTQQEREIKI